MSIDCIRFPRDQIKTKMCTGTRPVAIQKALIALMVTSWTCKVAETSGTVNRRPTAFPSTVEPLPAQCRLLSAANQMSGLPATHRTSGARQNPQLLRCCTTATHTACCWIPIPGSRNPTESDRIRHSSESKRIQANPRIHKV
jgi:hypothetical protein